MQVRARDPQIAKPVIAFWRNIDRPLVAPNQAALDRCVTRLSRRIINTCSHPTPPQSPIAHVHNSLRYQGLPIFTPTHPPERGVDLNPRETIGAAQLLAPGRDEKAKRLIKYARLTQDTPLAPPPPTAPGWVRFVNSPRSALLAPARSSQRAVRSASPPDAHPAIAAFDHSIRDGRSR